MSFSDEYFALEKKRKKKEEEEKQNTTSTKKSFSEEYAELERKRTATKGDDSDIAPLFVNKTAPLFAPVAENKRSFSNDRTEGTFGGEEKERKWFEKGAFSDGYQFWDVTKTILGTETDIREDIVTGVLGMGEKAVDAGAYVAGGVGALFGADKFKSNMESFIKKDLYDEEKVAKKIVLGYGIDSESNSVLGEKSDSLVQSGGQLAGTIGLQFAGVPWFVTSGVTSFGGEAENALNQGATYGAAGVSAAVSAGAEILTEKLFGGSGLGEKGLINLEPLTKGISSKVVKALADYGVDMAAEGAEEVVSQFIGNLGSALYKEENLADILFSEEAIDSYIESAIGGAALGGFANVGKVNNSIKSGKDYRTGLTTNEQKVVGKEFKDRVAEQEKSGEVTQKEKDKIYDQVLKDMERGYISTDTIEEVLGGDTYKSYRETVDSEDALTKEYEELGKKTGATLEEHTRYAELKTQIEEMKQNSQRNQLKSKLSEEVFGLVQADRLSESYNERGRKSQAFEADLTKYDTKYHGTIQKAIDSGILNNTNRTHEFVDMIAKISADKGVLFDFTNNAKLKESGFALEGKTVNGFVTKDGITLNINSAKALQTTVGHEITHVLEGTELYTELQTALTEYAKNRGEYDSRLATLTELYQGIEDADVNAELTADLVGDYLFSDTDFIKSLSVTNRDVFQKIYDEIKYLYKVATAGSKEARELEKVKRAFEDAYRESGKGAEGTKYSIGEIVGEDQQSYGIGVHLDSTLLENLNPKERVEMVKERIKELGGEVFTAYDNNGNAVDITIAKSEARFKNQSGKTKPVNQDLTTKHIGNETKQEAVVLADELIVTAKYDDSKPAAYPHGWLDNNGQNDWEYWTTYIQDKNNTIWEATLNVATTADGEKILYDVSPIKKARQSVKSDTSLLNDNVSQVGGDVKYSLSDSDGRQLSKEQQEYFKDSKMRDENGNLKVMYHGSQDAGFHVFDARMSDDDTSFFFVDRNDVAASYSGTSETYEAKAFRTAKDANKFFVEIGKKEYKVVERDGKYTLYDDGTEIAASESLSEIYDEFRDWEGIGYGDANYKVYLNLKNPLVVDAKGRNWNNVSREFSQEIADRYNALTAEEKDALADLAGWGEYGIFRDELLSVAKVVADRTLRLDDNSLNLASAVEKLGGANANLYDAFSIASDNFSEESIKQFATKQMKTRDYAKQAKEQGYDGVIFKNIVDVGGYGNGKEGAATVAVAFESNQIKSVANDKPTADKDIRYSLSNHGEAPVRRNPSDIYGKDVALESAPVRDNVSPVTENAMTEENLFPDDLAPVTEDDSERFNSLTDADVPPEVERYNQEQTVTVDDPFEGRDWFEVGKDRKAKAYMYENPEVKPFFQEEARILWGELDNTQKGERWYTASQGGNIDFGGYGAESHYRFGGTKRNTSKSMETLLDDWGMSYAQIEKGLKAIVEDNGAENIADAKHIEFMLNDRLLNGYKDFFTGDHIPPNQDYINLLNEKQINEYSKEAFDAFMANADAYAPVAEVEEEAPAPVAPVEDIAPVKEAYEAVRPKPKKEPRMAKATPQEQARAEILVEEPKIEKKSNAWNLFKDNFVDRGTIFETISLKTGNRELQGKWKAIGRAGSSAQWFMEHGNANTSSLKSIRDTVEQSGKTQSFYEYLHHQHNVDRMNLEERYEDVKNKPVFGYKVTSEMSKAEVAKLEAANPEFKAWAKEVYSYMTYLREMMVDNGVISRDTAKLWAEMYPHYVPIRRKGDEGLNINVALDTKRTGVNAPIKKATGGNSDILPLFDTMAMRTEQTFKAVARNRFGVDLKNLMGKPVETEVMDIDEAIDSVENEELLQEGKNGKNPTFTVFENGEKVTFEITDEIYNTMKPKSEAMGYTNKVLNTVNNVRRGLLTEYNPAFMVTNPIKDTQDVLINSQHPAKTYANYPKAISELLSKGQYFQEYMEHGGELNTYFDDDTKTFTPEKSGLSKVIGFPLEKISQANNFIERVPRMAEYIASRKEGRSIDVSMLDAARVTTDFSAGGDLIKFANRNGFTFLNASVQGAVQQVRNIREAKHEGLKGWAKLTAKVAVAGLPAILLNHLLWDDDEDYEELSDYVKQNYYVVAKYGDGKFVRIPKGRALAVIQDAFKQMENRVTGNDEVDFGAWAELFLNNLAPSNPLENNIIAPIVQSLNNTTWYGEDLVPSRLQDLPAGEQSDETTDSISKWLGEKLNISPYKINYVLDQYSGGVGDMILPMITPESERGNNTLAGNLIAPISDKFTTDSVLKNQNVSDFYDTKDKLTVNANASGATDEDALMSKYMNSINADLSELYKQKREIQNSSLSDAEKYEAVREIQKQIDALAEEGLNTYQDISFEDDYREGGEYARIGDKVFTKNEEGEWSKLSDEQLTKYEVTKAAGDASYATDGENHYRWYVPGEDAGEDAEEGWRKVTKDELKRQKEVTSGLDISPEEYWSNKEEYSYAYDYPENYAVARAVGGYESFKSYNEALYDIKADKDASGNSITGSRKEKVADYLNNLDADYYTKIILFKNEYNADDRYNNEIIEYLNGREDISYQDMETILKKLGFEVDSNGNISW